MKTIKYKIVTTPRVNFDSAFYDVEQPLSLHDRATKRKPGRPSKQIELFKRAGVILTITAWESFIEDTLKSAVEERLETASTPANIGKTFNAVAQAWLSDKQIHPPDLALWTLDGWKKMIMKRFDEEITGLNTPNSINIAHISKRYPNSDLTNAWHWQGTGTQSARRRLDDLISLRGELVHRARDFHETEAAVKRAHLADAIELIKRLVQATEVHLKCEPSRCMTAVAHKSLQPTPGSARRDRDRSLDGAK